MKKLLILFIVALVVGLGVAGYNVVIKIAANQMIDQVSTELLTEEEIAQLMDDPRVKALLNQDFSSMDLPFATKEEAMKAILKKFTMSELNEMKNKVLHGTYEERAEVKDEVEGRLSPDEITALKIIAVKELQQQK